MPVRSTPAYRVQSNTEYVCRFDDESSSANEYQEWRSCTNNGITPNGTIIIVLCDTGDIYKSTEYRAVVNVFVSKLLLSSDIFILE